MSVLYLVLYLVFILAFSVIVTGLVRRYSLDKSLLDVPNERSSHHIPTPRGGGLSVVLSVMVSLVVLYYTKWIDLSVFLAIGGGGLIIAVTGWLDDHRHISPLIRGIIYALASIWAVSFLGGLHTVKAGEHILNISLAGNVLTVLGIIWLTNLYNFMDGTDALAGSQSVCAGLFMGGLFLSGNQPGMAGLCFIIVVASAGFLIWNWPPARIFMGDVGSCFAGFCFGILAIVGEKTGSVPLVASFILLSLFICDATFTLIMRIFKREKWYSAHRSHAYQRLVQMGLSHKQLATGFAAFNIIILWPMAYIVFRWEQLSVSMMVLTVLLSGAIWSWIQVRFSKQITK